MTDSKTQPKEHPFVPVPGPLNECSVCGLMSSAYIHRIVPLSFEIEQPPYLDAQQKVLKDCMELMRTKSSDYCHPLVNDSLSNFRKSHALGVPAWMGTLVRMSDKWERIVTLAYKKTVMNEGPAVRDESIEDTLRDIINYAAIVLVLYREEQKK